jgi:hypothetical protein
LSSSRQSPALAANAARWCRSFESHFIIAVIFKEREMELLVSESLRWQETANELLEQSGLLSFLKERGEVYFTGSYRYGLLMSADIDLYLLHPQAGKEQALSVLMALIEQGYWNVYLYGDWVKFRAPDMPIGYYVGLKRDFAGARWKIDIWNTPQVAPNSLKYNAWIEKSLTPETRKIILAIKKANVLHKWNISGVTIYDAVLTDKVNNVEAFQSQFVEPSQNATS